MNRHRYIQRISLTMHKAWKYTYVIAIINNTSSRQNICSSLSHVHDIPCPNKCSCYWELRNVWVNCTQKLYVLIAYYDEISLIRLWSHMQIFITMVIVQWGILISLTWYNNTHSSLIWYLLEGPLFFNDVIITNFWKMINC